MTATDEADRPETDEGRDAEQIVRLRGEGPRVVRLSRKAIGLASAGGLALLGGILIFALRPATPGDQDELLGTQSVVVADGLAGAPSDYSQIPRLGPALPGDLGKPILDAQDRGAVAALPPIGPEGSAPQQAVTPEQTARQRIEQERDAARASRLFFGGAAASDSLAQAVPESGRQATGTVPETALAGQTSFPDRPAEVRTATLHRLEAAPSSFLLQAGSVIPAALITGIRSDQPGLVTAQVTQNIHDSLSGQHLLIPQGARLIGDYQSDVGFGQRRVLLAWHRLILPDGRSLILDRQPAADSSGYAGLEDGVDHHWGGVLKAAFISTLLGMGAEFGSGGDSELVRALWRGGQDSVNRAGEQVVSRELDIRPTLTIRPGFPVRVLVTRDIVMEDAS